MTKGSLSNGGIKRGDMLRNGGSIECTANEEFRLWRVKVLFGGSPDKGSDGRGNNAMDILVEEASHFVPQ